MTENIECYDQKLTALATARLRLREGIKAQLEAMGIDPANIDAYVADTALRDDLIRLEYNTERARGEKAEYLYYMLSQKYGLAYETICAICKKKTAKQ